MARGSELEADLRSLEADLRKLEAEYNMFFAGQLPRPPWETRTHVEGSIKRLERTVSVSGTFADRFRHQTLQSRLAAFVDLWDRGLRAREEGRPGPFAHRKRADTDKGKDAADRIVYVTVLGDPVKEMDRLRDLYERLTDVRRELGESQVPFHKFAGLVRDKVAAFRAHGAPEVAFRVAVHDGKITFTARGLKGTRAG
ncbi:MAG: hypothetical protein NTY02_06355 [Acidobacteria bacterium]|nr:hypothetical protein [Acidobacteriota bacterium]